MIRLFAADAVHPVMQALDQRNHSQRLVPFHEIGSLAGDNLLHQLDLAPALLDISRHNRFQVVDIVEKAGVIVGQGGIDIARHCEVDHENRPGAPFKHGARPLLGKDIARSAGGADQDIRLFEIFGELLKIHRCAVIGHCQLHGFAVGAIGYQH